MFDLKAQPNDETNKQKNPPTCPFVVKPKGRIHKPKRNVLLI